MTRAETISWMLALLASRPLSMNIGHLWHSANKVMLLVLTAVLMFVYDAAAPTVEAQQASKVARVGVLAGGGDLFRAGFESFRQRLRELGYVEDQNIALFVRTAEGRAERYPDLAAELVQLRVDVILAQGNPALAALKQATPTIPIVMAQVGDPVGSGFVASLATPGGNITGLSNMAEGVSGKWVELLKEMSPKTTRLAVLWDPRLRAHTAMWKGIQVAGEALNVTPLAWEVRGPDDIERAFSAMSTERIGALVILPWPVAGQNRRLIVDRAATHRLPAIYAFREFAEAGCLMTYGPNNADLYRRAANYVDRILKGAKPAELPVAQPTTFELIINLRTAKALGLTVPPSLLLRADQVIE
jgi:putative ABC transport system substrate-binding protein